MQESLKIILNAKIILKNILLSVLLFNFKYIINHREKISIFKKMKSYIFNNMDMWQL